MSQADLGLKFAKIIDKEFSNTDDKNGDLLKKEMLKKCDILLSEYALTDDFLARKYLVQRIIDLISEAEFSGFPVNQLRPIKQRMEKIERYTQIYDYSLAEQLQEQKTIVADSIQSSPFHIKRLELKNTAMIQFQQNLDS
jgi:hypothetical protein